MDSEDLAEEERSIGAEERSRLEECHGMRGDLSCNDAGIVRVRKKREPAHRRSQTRTSCWVSFLGRV